jgi:hypothetical protein
VSRLMRALEKAGLVEIDQREAVPSTPAPEPEVIAEPAPLPLRERVRASMPADSGSAPSAPPPGGAIQEQRPFDDIYAAGQVASSPFSAEKLMKIMEGLGALEPASRKAAVLALDAADDAWTIDDALLDAERKARALDLAKKQIEDQARAALEHARSEIEAREQRQADAVARIRQQIAELEGLLEREVARATEEKAALQETARAAKEACVRESMRYDAEVARLRRLADVFAPAPVASR